MNASVKLSVNLIGSILVGGVLLNSLVGPVQGALVSTPGQDARLADKLQEILSHQEIVFEDDGQGGLLKTLRFKGLNVQVVDDSGSTEGTPTGLGNLIVGYNEMGRSPKVHTGSHNLVVGNEHNYTRFGGIVAGKLNSNAGDFSTISGGLNNRTLGAYSSVSGGCSNRTFGLCSSISGGSRSDTIGANASVSGGSFNNALGTNTSIGGGFGNSADSAYATVSGGRMRTVDGLHNWAAGSLFEDN